MTKKSIVKLILNTIRKESISEDFINKHKIGNASFTRKRKLCFERLLLFILGNSKTSLSLELSRFIDDLNLPANTFITKQAFSKARQKISYSAFIELFKASTNIILAKAKINTYRNYQLVAVDGTTIQVPDTQENRNYFGVIKAHNSNPIALARATIIYDVLNDLIMDAKLVYYNTSERVIFKDLLKRFTPHKKFTPLFLLDRGYPSKEIIKLLDSQNFKFVMRVSKSFIKAVNVAASSDSIITYKEKRYGTSEKKLRVLKIPLISGETEILVTNIYDKGFDVNDFKQLYHMRWGVETKYNEVKHKYTIEKFTGIKPLSVEQDFYGALLMANITGLLKVISDDQLKQETRLKGLKHQYQTNKNVIIGMFHDYFIDMMLHPKTMNRKLAIIINRIKKSRSLIRPNRTRERKKVHTKLNYPLNNKPVF